MADHYAVTCEGCGVFMTAGLDAIEAVEESARRHSNAHTDAGHSREVTVTHERPSVISIYKR